LVEKLVQKRIQRNTGNNILTDKPEQHGTKVSVNSKTKPLEIVAVGTCPECHKLIIRPDPCDVGICKCKSIIEVNLHPAMLLPFKLSRKFERIVALIKEAGVEVSLEDFVNKLLDVGLEDYAAKQKWRIR
jgi:hypothetical protein